MGGSYRHITNADNTFRGTELIDNLGDAYGALEECYDMIQHLANGDKLLIFEAWRDGHLQKVCPSNVPGATFEDFWSGDDDEDDNPTFP